jgi:solute carrier family 34 (sodium-dependent phosphate cotransporter)
MENESSPDKHRAEQIGQWVKSIMEPKHPVAWKNLLSILLLFGVLYFFFVSIELMGSSFKLFGKGFAEGLISTTNSPLVGLFIGILATSIIQSSSSTTSIVVGLVASGVLSIENAIPIIMGANIGTSVTNTLVALGHISRREEFRRAIAGATVHDFFNLLTVSVLLPLEVMTGYLSTVAHYLENIFEGMGGLKLLSPLKVIVKPLTKFIEHSFTDVFGLSNVFAGVLLLITALSVLFVSLNLFVRIIRKIVVGRVESIINDVIFQSAVRSFIFGMILTAVVQSSSITTSIIVPMIGAGILTVPQFFPYTLGANIGTTITAILAAMSTGNPAAVTIAFAHLMFNVTGVVIFYPLRFIPIKLSHLLGDISARWRPAAIIFIVTSFFLIPMLLILLTR